MRYARFERGHAARVYHSCSVMLDPALLRERLDVVNASTTVRARPRTRSEDHDAELDRLARVDARRRAINPELEVIEPPR